jgi:hypothetical protein
MARTEVTVGQHFAFVQAVRRPFYDYGSIRHGRRQRLVTGHEYRIIRPGTNGRVSSPPAGKTPRQSADMSFEYAARYCNWLHNGKVNEAWAFESGAYDTSTFNQNPDGTYNHQLTRSEGARYWIPSHDEWVKAAYYDPNRYGEGEEGYWLFPNPPTRSPSATSCPRRAGAQRGNWNDYPWPLDVGSFSHVRSYYGSLTWPVASRSGRRRLIRSSWAAASFAAPAISTMDTTTCSTMTERTSFTSRLGGLFQLAAIVGLRLASVIPCPADLAPPTGTLNAADLIAYLDLYHASDPAADLADPLGTLNFFDLAAYLQAFIAGCP